MCGATGGQQQAAANTEQLTKTLTSQAQQIFGSAMGVFNDLVSVMGPIEAAGPNQQGWSPPLMNLENSKVITETGQQYANASRTVREQQAAFGGGNVPMVGGSQIGQNLSVAEAAAAQTASELQQNQIESLRLGNQNWRFATSALSGAPQVFNPATEAGNAATNAANANVTAQNDIAQANNSVWDAALGAIGGIAGQAVGGITTGGMANLGKGVGFFG